MEDLIENQGLCHIVIHISNFLDAKSLAQCSLVSQSWRGLVERQWLSLQLEHIKTKPKEFLDFKDWSEEPEDPDMIIINSTISDQFPKWNQVMDHFKKERMERLKDFVEQMWIYIKDEEIQLTTIQDPWLHAIRNQNKKLPELLDVCGIDP